MKVATYEATVENGQIRFLDAVCLPEHARVYVVVTEREDRSSFHAGSPHLAQPERVAAFTMEVAEEPQDAGLR